MFFRYGEKEITYLEQKDKRLAEVIDKVGKIDRKLFEKYRRRFSPYCSVASLYFWAVAGGAVPGMKDYAPKRSHSKNERTRKNAGNSK